MKTGLVLSQERGRWSPWQPPSFNRVAIADGWGYVVGSQLHTDRIAVYGENGGN